MKFCKDCEFFKDSEYGGFRCSNTLGEPDIVTGYREMLPCYVERGREGGCGPHGKNFRPSLSHKFKTFLLFKLDFSSNG